MTELKSTSSTSQSNLSADESKVGRDWREDELDAIVADYFEMLLAELSGQRYVKSNHSRALMARIGRTHRSVEFKHQNISAVLETLGLPWIRGYKPKRNYQAALIPAIDRYLSANPLVLAAGRSLPPAIPDALEIFVDQPKAANTHRPTPEPIRRLVRKFDPAMRDHHNRILGKAGEQLVIEIERRRLIAAERADLAQRIRWVSVEDGDGAGYDILSYDAAGNRRLIEVKTTNGSAMTPFFLTRKERALATERPQEWRIYRVHKFSENPKIFIIAPPLEASVRLEPHTWRASF